MILRPRNCSAGEMPVDRWDVTGYIIKNLRNSCFYLAWAALMIFSNVLLKRSTAAYSCRPVSCDDLVFRNDGVQMVTWCPDLKSCDMNWGPLSDTISAG